MKILLENLLRREDNAFVKADDIRALAQWDATASAREGDLLHAGARAAAGLHRRAVRRRPRGDARRDGGARRQSRSRQPAAAGRARHRPLGAGRLLRAGPTPSRSTPSSSSRATASATRSCAGASARSTTSRSCRPTPGIVHQVNIEYLARVVFSQTVGRQDGRLSRHAGRHRLAHHDGQRPRRRRLGRRRHRGRGGDARPADLDADSAGARLPADRRDAAGRDRHRPGADDHRGRCASTASSASSSSSSATGSAR